MTWKSTGAQIIHILSNSWGPDDDGITLAGPGDLTLEALKSAVLTGRNGKGTIITWAGGNGENVTDNSNYDGYANSIYTIAVGAFDSQSRQAYYSEPGANLVICAPSNGSSPALGIATVDRSGTLGYNDGTDPNEISDSNYTQTPGGTSSATPTVSGIIALILEANPNLGWRDVQEIIMRSAKKVDSTDADWKTPIAPDNINHNHKYGAGLIDATAGVSMAVNWVNLSAQLKRSIPQKGLNIAIPNKNTTGITREFVITPQDNLRVEHVTVTVNINHSARGNLKITLTSPNGTVSRLAEVHSDTNDNYANWTFMTVRNWGESALGTWQLKVTDESDVSNTAGGTLTLATMEIFGSTTFSTWASNNSLSGNDALLLSDPDRDGRSNLVEFYMGSDPSSTFDSPIVVTASSTSLSMTYRRAKGIANISAVVEWTTDLSLANWNTNDVSEIVDDKGLYEEVKATVINSPGEKKKFMRLRVTAR